MCLSTNQAELRVSEDDITVYKLISVCPSNLDFFNGAMQLNIDKLADYRYLSYYRLEEIDVHCVEDGVPYAAVGVSVKRRNYDVYKYKYGSGLIHTFKYKDDAICIFEKSVSNVILYRCVIPKGTEYVSGEDNNGFGSYASKQIVFEEPVHFRPVAKEWHDKLMNNNQKNK